MKKLNKLFFTLLITFLSIDFYRAAAPPPPGGDTGTQGSPATPIDMYIFVLIAAAIVMLFVFAKKFKKQVA